MPLRSAGLCLFAWDFAEEGADELIAHVRDLGVTRLYPAVLYHAGYFIHPHSPKRKVRLLDDGVAYFHPDMSLYADTPLKPTIAPMCAETDWLQVICDKARPAGLDVAAWTVFFHNTRLGLLHPECTVINAFGDSYPHALSPGHPDVRAYGRAVVTDLASRYPLHSIMLEAPNYRGRKHGASWVAGHHHERRGIHLRDLEEALMDVSFNPADVAACEEAGINMTGLRDVIRRHMERYFDAAPDMPSDLPDTLDAFIAAHPALADYHAVCDHHEKTLNKTLHDIAAPHGVKLLGGMDPSFDAVMTGSYGAPLDEMGDAVERASATKRADQNLSVFVRIGFVELNAGMWTAIRTVDDMCDFTQCVVDCGADEIVYYNYSEAPRRSSDWIKPALRSVGFAPEGA